MEKEIRFFALENALKFNGKANTGAVVGKILALHPEARKDMKTLSKKIQQIVKEVNSLPGEEQKKQFKIVPKIKKPEKEEQTGLPELPNAQKGKVVTRIPPEPSKYSHLGHALSFLINYTYAKKYDGKCIVRFEETNPEKASQEYADAILEDLDYIGIKPDKVHFASDDMPKFYDMAEKLIMMKKAYVCICDQESVRNLRREKKCCRCAMKNDVGTNLAEWKKMLKGEYKEGEAILRLVGDMESKNAVMRDPIIFRINKSEHFRQKKKYYVWPLYDFENSVEDSLNGVTHILRSSEFGRMRIELQSYIKKLLGLKDQEIVQYGRFNIRGATTKGREIRALIKEGKVSGWDDPSLVTIKALRRRGIVPDTFTELMYQMKLSSNSSKNIDWSMISSINKSILDDKVNRYFFIKNPKKIKIKNAPSKSVELKFHPDHPEKGTRKLKTGEEFYITKEDFNILKKQKFARLMDCINFTIEKNRLTYHSDKVEEFRKKKGHIMQWIPVSEDLAKVSVRMPDNTKVTGLAEPLVKKIRIGEIIQFQRFGFCRLDHIEENTYVFWFTNR